MNGPVRLSSTASATFLDKVRRLQYPPDIRVIRLPCSGRVSPKFILSDLRMAS